MMDEKLATPIQPIPSRPQSIPICEVCRQYISQCICTQRKKSELVLWVEIYGARIVFFCLGFFAGIAMGFSIAMDIWR